MSPSTLSHQRTDISMALRLVLLAIILDKIFSSPVMTGENGIFVLIALHKNFMAPWYVIFSGKVMLFTTIANSLLCRSTVPKLSGVCLESGAFDLDINVCHDFSEQCFVVS